MTDAEIPQFRVPNVGEPIPAVDPEDLRRRWNIKRGDREALIAARSHEVDSPAVSRRDGMIRMLADFKDGQLLAPWHHGEELDDAVFRVAATFPMRALHQGVYKIAGDEIFGFDPNAFVQRLIEETGISHVWEPILARIPEGEWSYSKVCVTFNNQGPPDPEREAKRDARDLLWDVWSRYNNLSQLSHHDKEQFSHLVAILFADFVIDNIDLAREFISPSSAGSEGGRPSFAILRELERRAQGWRP